MFCNNWECPHNWEGNCESIEGQTKCNDELLKLIAKSKEKKIMTEDLKQELLNKQAFVNSLANTLVENDIPCLEDITYEVYSKDEGYIEYIVMHYKGGAVAPRNSSHNSKNAIYREIGKLLEGGYYKEVDMYNSIKESEEWERLI